MNVGGKVLEKLLIDRILHHLHSNNLLSNNQYGFTPQRGTIDAAMTLKDFVQQALSQKHIVLMTSLDVKGAFDAAWWPSILFNLKSLKCPKNLFKLAESYFSNRSATLILNTYKAEKQVSKGCPQGSCSGLGFWNILYDTLLKLEFSNRTKVIAFAGDFIVLTKGAQIKEVENYANQDLKMIEKWAKENKIQFNDNKSQTLLISKRKINK